MTDAAIANTDQAAHWSEAGQVWVEHSGPLDRFLDNVTPPLLAAAFPGEGGRVLDIGCGYGSTTLEMARRLGPNGRCVGVDISAPMLGLARGRAAETANVDFLQADAQTADLGREAFDAAMSRFGVMFFEDPDAAFANIRRAIRAGGRLAFVAWRSPMENAFFAAPAMAAAALLPTAPAPDPDAPGQFAFADAGKVRGVLERSGWTDIAVEPLDAPVSVTRQDAMDLLLGVGPAGAAVRAEPTLKPKLTEAVTQALEPYRDGDRLKVTAACWLVTAKA
ncbi:class I SAM-dependent methyltransferase [Phenylobacterium terrae]|uniref:Class I SAM-dependent methyltransferase n=1 Tax=Phenylobacterium terrae TaxID=2665495 RepID=A0ABW4N1T2_9CAUL